jgi:hypothetical protein
MDTKAPPLCPLKADPIGILMGALCQSDGRQNGRRECAFDNELKGCQHLTVPSRKILIQNCV